MALEDIGVNRELRELENERKLHKIVLKSEQEKIAKMLKGEMGKDMKDVINGRKRVKMPFFQMLKYKINYWLDKLFSVL